MCSLMHGQKNFIIFVLEILLKYQVTIWWFKNLLLWSNKEAVFFSEIKKKFHFPWNGPAICTKWLKVGMNDTQKWTEEVLEPNKAIFLCFSLSMYTLYDSARKQFLQIYRIWICWYPVYQISKISTFSIYSEFCAENWLCFAVIWAANE